MCVCWYRANWGQIGSSVSTVRSGATVRMLFLHTTMTVEEEGDIPVLCNSPFYTLTHNL